MDTTIPNDCEAIVPTNLVCSRLPRSTPKEQWTTTPGEPTAGLRVARTLLPNQGPAAAVRVCNITHKPIRLYPGQSLGALQPVNVAAEATAPTAEAQTAAEQR